MAQFLRLLCEQSFSSKGYALNSTFRVKLLGDIGKAIKVNLVLLLSKYRQCSRQAIWMNQ
jgi:hypothetical protein